MSVFYLSLLYLSIIYLYVCILLSLFFWRTLTNAVAINIFQKIIRNYVSVNFYVLLIFMILNFLDSYPVFTFIFLCSNSNFLEQGKLCFYFQFRLSHWIIRILKMWVLHEMKSASLCLRYFIFWFFQVKGSLIHLSVLASCTFILASTNHFKSQVQVCVLFWAAFGLAPPTFSVGVYNQLLKQRFMLCRNNLELFAYFISVCYWKRNNSIGTFLPVQRIHTISTYLKY